MSNIPIFLSSDDNYAPFVATTIASICNNTKSFCEFYVLDGGITEENKEKICELKNLFDNFSVEFIFIDVENKFKNFNEAPYITKSMYSRFLIPDLKPNIDKAIYSDVDVIVMGDIAKMYHEDLGGFSLGAIWQELFDNTPFVEDLKSKFNLSKEHKIFFSGNLLIDCEKWREQNIPENLLKLASALAKCSKTPDQDVLNMYFDNNYKILSEKYCFVNQDFDFYKEPKEIIVRHYNGQIKPWNLNPDTKTSLFHNLEDFWFYAKKTAFYQELYQKTLNTEEQKSYLRKLQYWKNANRVAQIVNLKGYKNDKVIEG